MKKLTVSILCLLMCLMLCVSVFAAVPPVVDQSGLLTDQEQSDLNTYFGKIREEEGYAVNVVTTDSFEGKSAQSYAEDFYDDHIGGDGVLLLVSLQEGYWYISTNGICAQKISDSHTNDIGEAVIDLVREGEYYEAFHRFGGLVSSQMTQHSEQKNGVSGAAVIVCLVIGLAAAGITTGIMAAQMKTVRSQSGAGSYVCPGSLQLTGSHDIFLYNTMSRTPRPKSNGSGGGGRSRGGSGGRI